MKNLNDELRKLDEYNYKVSADFSKKVMKKIHKGHFMDSMKYVVSFASLAAVACFAVVMYTNPNLKGRFFGVKKESEDLAIYNNAENASINNSLSNSTESYQDFAESVKENQTDSTPSETEASQGVFRGEDDKVIEDKTTSNDSLIKNNDTTFESMNTTEAASSKLNEKEELIKKIQKAGFSVTEVENGLKVKATKQELEDLLKDENIELEEQKDGIIVKLP